MKIRRGGGGRERAGLRRAAENKRSPCSSDLLKFICDRAYKIQQFIAITLLLTGSLAPPDKIIGGRVAPFTTPCTHYRAPSVQFSLNNAINDVALWYQGLLRRLLFASIFSLSSFAAEVFFDAGGHTL